MQFLEILTTCLHICKKCVSLPWNHNPLFINLELRCTETACCLFRTLTFNPIRLLQTWKWLDLLLSQPRRITAFFLLNYFYRNCSSPKLKLRTFLCAECLALLKNKADLPTAKPDYRYQTAARCCSEIFNQQGKDLSNH